jgi:hypothetical protein
MGNINNHVGSRIRELRSEVRLWVTEHEVFSRLQGRKLAFQSAVQLIGKLL